QQANGVGDPSNLNQQAHGAKELQHAGDADQQARCR
ncbi:MAG: hypothetical protein QOD88_1783, partial [Mycobacterium sp.]|nr:hypothetical protein [Mycobacterium sp.]